MQRLRLGGVRALGLWTFLACLLGFGSTAHAQVISGTVFDETKGALPGVTVTVRNMDTGATRTLITDDAGRYRAPNLPLGRYEIRAELSGFRPVVRQGVTLTVGDEVAVSLTLSLSELTEDLVVLGEAPLVNTTQAAVGGIVDTGQIESLPLFDRSYINLALLTPGVVMSSVTGTGGTAGPTQKINIGGTRGSTGTIYTLDGSDITSNFGGIGSASGRSLGVEAIREFKVITSPFSAEYSKASGGEVRIATRSGTNRFLGAASYFHRDSALDARNFFDIGRPAPLTMHQYTVALGGPILRDRTFFFVNYEGLREKTSSTSRTAVPREHVHQGFAHDARGVMNFYGVDPRVKPYLDLYPMPNGRVLSEDAAEFIWENTRNTSEHYTIVRIDHQFAGGSSVYGRTVFNPGEVTSPGDMGMSVERSRSPTRYLAFGWDTVLSARAVNAFQISHNRSMLDTFDEAVDPRAAALFSWGSAANIPPLVLSIAPGSGISGLGASGSNPRLFNYQVLQVKDDFSLQLQAHSLKMGALVQHYFDTNDSAFNRQPAAFGFEGVDFFLRAIPQDFTATLPNSDALRHLRHWNVGFYVQDDWRATSTLTLNAGLRYEFMTVPTERDGKTAMLRATTDPNATLDDIVIGDPLFQNPSLRNFAPRIGFAWDVRGDGRTSLRGGVGVFYDLIQQLTMRAAWNRTPPFQTWGVASAVDVGPIDFPNAYGTQVDTLAEAAIAIENIDFNVEQPTVYQYGLTAQRELPGQMAAEVQYRGSRGVDLLVVSDFNHRVPEVLPDGRLFFGPDAPVFNPNFDRIRTRRSDGESWYNALILGLRQRPRAGFAFQASYTLGKATDNGSNALGSGDHSNEGADRLRPVPPPFALDRSDNEGLSAFDIRHNFVLNASYELPIRLSGVARTLFGEWVLSGILRLTSGPPFTPMGNRSSSTRSTNRWGQFGSGPPDLVPGAKPQINEQNPDRYFEPDAFSLPPPGFFGNAGRNILTGPGIAMLDFSLQKHFSLGGNREMQVRGELFNALNRANFDLPSASVFRARQGDVNPNVGRITGTSTRARAVQFGVRFTF